MNQTTLEWQTFNGSIPNGAVSIYNDYAKRTEYVARCKVSSGFYNPQMGPYCFYPWCLKEHRGSPFEILVNKNNFEFLEWKDSSCGSVPDNSVVVSESRKVYVGKNEYGLGKVDVINKSFYLPCDGKEYQYNSYQVLTFNRDIISEHISDVKYKTGGVKIMNYPPEIMDTKAITNNDCETVTGTATLSGTNQVQQKWDTNYSVTVSGKTTITAGIPLIGSTSIDFTLSGTFQYITGTTNTESTISTLSVNYKVPPNHSCTVRMVGHKCSADIPYTAILSRTYRNGKTTQTSISGTYKRVQYREFRAVVDRCEPLSGSRPCPRKK